MMEDVLGLVAQLNGWASEIENDATPSQVGPTASDLRRLAQAVHEARSTGWIGWGGGNNPVSANVHVIVRWRGGQTYSGLAGGFQWHRGEKENAWDIIAFAIDNVPAP